MELTKEHFDQALKSFSTKADLEAVENRLTKRIDAAKEELAVMTKRRFDEVTERLDVRGKVDELQRQMLEVRQELNIA
jgi:hypothetical protein